MLAQTCSSIGKDSSSSAAPCKSIIPPIEKTPRDSADSSPPVGLPPTRSPSSGVDRPPSCPSRAHSRADSGSPAAAQDDVQRTFSRSPTPESSAPCRPGFRAPVTAKEAPPPLVASHGSPAGDDKSSASRSPGSNVSPRSAGRSATPATSDGPHSSSSKISLSCGNMFLEVNHQETTGLARPPAVTSLPPSSAHHHHHHHSARGGGVSPVSSLKLDGAVTSLAPSYPGCHGLSMLGHAMDPTLNSLYPPAAFSAHHLLGLAAGQRPGCVSPTALAHHATASMSPYMAYARVKTASGATTLVPVCKDPYCSHCQLTAHSGGACGAGCLQCGHDRSLGLVPPGSALPLSSPLYPHGYGGLSSAAAVAAAAAAAAAVSHHGTAPYVCNWVSGSDYCGKRFASSEELWQHLRTHTSAADSVVLSAGMQYPGFGLPPHSPYASLASPASLRLNYPRTLSPNSLLAASRYHPYKPSLASLPSMPSPLMPGVPPSLSAYYSPYSLYSQRLGATVTP